MVETREHPHYRVEFEDDFLDIDDFATIEADSEDEARQKFWDERDDEDRYTITNVEHVFDLPEIVEA